MTSQDAPRCISLADARSGRPKVAAAYEQARLRFELLEAIRAAGGAGLFPAAARRPGRDDPARCRAVRGWRHRRRCWSASPPRSASL